MDKNSSQSITFYKNNYITAVGIEEKAGGFYV